MTVSLIPEPSFTVLPSADGVLPSLTSLPNVGLSLFSHDFKVMSGLLPGSSGTGGPMGDAIVLVSLAITAFKQPLRDFGGLFRLLEPPATDVVGTIVILGGAVDVGDGKEGLATTGVIVVDEGKLRCFNFNVPVGDDGGCFVTGLLLGTYELPDTEDTGLLGLLFWGDFTADRLSASVLLFKLLEGAGWSGFESFFPLLTNELADFFRGGRDVEGLTEPCGFVVRLKACWESSSGSGEAATAG